MANDLTPISAAPPSLSDIRLSTPLWRLLNSSLPADIEVGEILCDPALHIECKRVAPMLQHAAAPCGDAAVREALKPLALVYPPGKRAEAPAFWAVYFRSLSTLPMEALLKAVDEYPNTTADPHFPTPGAIKDLAEKHAIPIRKAAYRAKRAADSLPRRPERDRSADHDAIHQMAEDTAARLRSREDRT